MHSTNKIPTNGNLLRSERQIASSSSTGASLFSIYKLRELQGQGCLIPLHDQVREDLTKNVGRFFRLSRPSVERSTEAAVSLSRVAHRKADDASAALFDVPDDLFMGIGDGHNQANVGANCASSGVFNGPLVDADTPLAIKKASHVMCVWCSNLLVGFHAASIPQLSG